MAAPKATTLQSRFGFQDTDLTTPQHDEIILWINDNIEKIIKEIAYSSQWQPDNEIHVHYSDSNFGGYSHRVIKLSDLSEYIIIPEELKDQSTQILNPPVKPQLMPVDIKVIWEYPVIEEKYRSKYTIGFVDVLATFPDWQLSLEGFYNTAKQNRPLQLNPNYNWKWEVYKDIKQVAFEAKTIIPSLGELVRQIRMYQTYMPTAKFVIVSPDDRFAQPLKGQGIDFYKYAP